MATTARMLLIVAFALMSACSRTGDGCTYISGGADTCVSGAECIPPNSVLVWDRGTCHESCSTDADCKGGLKCSRIYGPDKVCWD